MQVFKAIKEHRNFALRCILFSAVLFIVLFDLSLLLMPKSFINDEYPGTSSILGFYDLPEDSIDVLFLGSSHAINGFDTQKLYEDHGIRSFTLGSGEQNVAVSWFYLNEALKTQKPDAVVMDTLMAFPFRKNKILYSSAPSTEKALNFMKFGSNKLRAIFELAQYDEELSTVEMLLPFLRYHERWNDLKENDLRIFSSYATLGLHGYNVKYGELEEDEYDYDYEPFDGDDAEDIGEKALSPVIEKYLDRICETCRKNGIKLIFVKTPSNKTGLNEYDTMKEYAEKRGVHYLDYNEEDLYDTIGFDFDEDMGNIGHTNYLGSGKITCHLGKVLLENGVTPGGIHEEWDRTGELYDDMCENFYLSVSETKEDYLSCLDTDRHSIFLLNDENGKNTTFLKNGDEESSDDTGKEITGILKGTMTGYSVLNNDEEKSVKIGGDEKLEETGDRNIVVFDQVTKDVIDVSYYNDAGELIHQ